MGRVWGGWGGAGSPACSLLCPRRTKSGGPAAPAALPSRAAGAAEEGRGGPRRSSSRCAPGKGWHGAVAATKSQPCGAELPPGRSLPWEHGAGGCGARGRLRVRPEPSNFGGTLLEGSKTCGERGKLS